MEKGEIVIRRSARRAMEENFFLMRKKNIIIEKKAKITEGSLTDIEESPNILTNGIVAIMERGAIFNTLMLLVRTASPILSSFS